MTDPQPSAAVTDPPAAPPERQRPGGRGRLLWALVVTAVLATAGALVAAGVAAVSHDPSRPSAAAAEDYGPAPSYRLVDQNGRPVTSRSFAGRVQVVSFLFPYCTTYCPLLARDMARLSDEVARGPLRGKVALVSFNVDPQGAGPATLRGFMRQYGGDPAGPDWEYLTGTPQQIRAVVTGGFHVFYDKTSLAKEKAEAARQQAAGTLTPQPQQPNPLAERAHVSYDVVHNDYVEIVSASGRIVAVFDQASTLSPSRLLAAVRDAVAGRAIPPQPVR